VAGGKPPAYFIPSRVRGGSSGFSTQDAVVQTYTWGWMSMLARRKPDVSIEARNGGPDERAATQL